MTSMIKKIRKLNNRLKLYMKAEEKCEVCLVAPLSECICDTLSSQSSTSTASEESVGDLGLETVSVLDMKADLARLLREKQRAQNSPYEMVHKELNVLALDEKEDLLESVASEVIGEKKTQSTKKEKKRKEEIEVLSQTLMASRLKQQETQRDKLLLEKEAEELREENESLNREYARVQEAKRQMSHKEREVRKKTVTFQIQAKNVAMLAQKYKLMMIYETQHPSIWHATHTHTHKLCVGDVRLSLLCDGS